MCNLRFHEDTVLQVGSPNNKVCWQTVHCSPTAASHPFFKTVGNVAGVKPYIIVTLLDHCGSKRFFHYGSLTFAFPLSLLLTDRPLIKI